MATASPEERSAFWDQLMKELPAYLDWLGDLMIPEDLVSQRFGVQAFLHPAVISGLQVFEPEMQLLELIDTYLFESTESSIEKTAADIQRLLTSDHSICRYEARKLLPGSNTCGRYLSRLAKTSPRVSFNRAADRRGYIIKRRPDDG